ncbi:hypothetical protein FIM07_01385 [SAR202 cluster bacterium AD-802-F09_MRT_200m]|nr:hypothetical protein [SAR202 cluster bacterium AD-802-F09_MRT_200m]
MITNLTSLCVGPESSINQTLVQLGISAKGIVLVVDSEMRLLGTVTDGDMRRGVLAGVDHEKPVTELLARSGSTRPISAPEGTEPATLLAMLRDNSIRHIPLIDHEHKVVALAIIDDFVPDPGPALQAVIMAGGLGQRLRPLTEEVPKPMLPVGDRPLLESMLEQLSGAGINLIKLVTNYKKEVISNYFGNGASFGVEIQYVEEDQPLGTAGGLGLLEASDKPLLVINGDILTKVDFRAMADFHRDNKADMSVAVKEQEFQIPYGVVETDGLRITGILEKPVMRHFINAGIYLLNSELRRYIPAAQAYDMTDLIERVLKDGCNVVSFPIHEYWLDIGQHEDYAQAQDDAAREKAKP